MNKSNFIFVDLAAQADGAKPFDGFSAGEFIDMYGRKAIFKKADLATYVKNTKAVLESTRDSDGNIVGLPIDAMNHEHAEAAGWLVDVALAEGRDIIQFTPRWNQLGTEMISNDITRFFSPSVNMANKTIMGGSLTNWPATRDNTTGKILLRPIELALSMSRLEFASDESLLARANRIARAFRDTFRATWEAEYAWPVDVFEGYLICELNEKLFKVDYQESGDTVKFSEFVDWVEVKQAYVEAAMNQFANWNFGLLEHVSNGGGSAADTSNSSSEEPMTIKLNELAPEDRAELVKEVAGQLRGDVQPPSTPVDLSALLNLDGLSEEAKNKIKADITAQYTALQQQAQLEWQIHFEQVKRENAVTELAQKLVGGTEANPRGLLVQMSDLKKHLLSIPAEDAKFFSELLSSIQEGKGLIEFGEKGHGRVLQGTRTLDPKMAVELRKWLDGDKGHTVDEFFRVNSDILGNQSDYNLTEFAGR